MADVATSDAENSSCAAVAPARAARWRTSAFAPPHSVFRAYRMLGWLYNEDGLWLGPNCTVQDSFIR